MNKSIVTPSDCLLLFGIPTTKAAFFDDIERKDKDFASLFGGRWSRYEYQFVSELNRLRKSFEKTGLKILENATLNDFEKELEKYQVIILFSHWVGSQVEFSDGLRDIDNVVDAIPQSFNGVIDLCVCHPNQLAKKIREARPNVTVKYTAAPATPLMWLNFYSILFHHLHEKPADYVSSLVQLTKAYANTQLL